LSSPPPPSNSYYNIVNPYDNDLTRSTDIEKIVEQFIKDNWDQTKTTVALSKIKFGQWSDAILSGQTEITLKVLTKINAGNTIELTSKRWKWTAFVDINISVLNNATNQSYDVRAMNIMKFLEELFILNQGESYQGVYSFIFRTAVRAPDIEHKNIDNRKISIIATYIGDITQIIIPSGDSDFNTEDFIIEDFLS